MLLFVNPIFSRIYLGQGCATCAIWIIVNVKNIRDETDRFDPTQPIQVKISRTDSTRLVEAPVVFV